MSSIRPRFYCPSSIFAPTIFNKTPFLYSIPAHTIPNTPSPAFLPRASTLLKNPTKMPANGLLFPQISATIFPQPSHAKISYLGNIGNLLRPFRVAEKRRRRRCRRSGRAPDRRAARRAGAPGLGSPLGPLAGRQSRPGARSRRGRRVAPSRCHKGCPYIFGPRDLGTLGSNASGFLTGGLGFGASCFFARLI